MARSCWVIALLLTVAACGAAEGGERPSLGARDASRLPPPETPTVRPGRTPQARAARSGRLVGALFSHSVRGGHYCTASPVDGPSRNLLITAAHCIHEGKGGGYLHDLLFVPAYRDGHAPYGVWKAERLFVDARWARHSDPDLDVGFIALRPLHGRQIADVLGANRLGIRPGFRNVVRVTGYPSAAKEPITCVNRTRRQARYQLAFTCRGFRAGTSGSPWVARRDPTTGSGVVVGVIGGYQYGGRRDAISYSAYFDGDVEALYETAGRTR